MPWPLRINADGIWHHTGKYPDVIVEFVIGTCGNFETVNSDGNFETAIGSYLFKVMEKRFSSELTKVCKAKGKVSVMVIRVMHAAVFFHNPD